MIAIDHSGRLLDAAIKIQQGKPLKFSGAKDLPLVTVPLAEIEANIERVQFQQVSGVWTNERAYGRTDGQTDGRANERSDGQTNKRTDRRTNKRAVGRTNERADGRTNERSDGQTNERSDKRMNERRTSDRTNE